MIPTIEVVDPGAQTTVQDYPGRADHGRAGTGACGPMDDLSFRLGNRAIGNREGAAGLEFAGSGPSLRFNFDLLVCLAGAEMHADVDGTPVGFWEPFRVAAGCVLTVGELSGEGIRAYLLVAGGLVVAPAPGAGSSNEAGGAGGYGHRRVQVKAGDGLWVAESSGPQYEPGGIPEEVRPINGTPWEIAVLDGPDAMAGLIIPATLEAFYESEWEVHPHAQRSGIRLRGPRLEWSEIAGSVIPQPLSEHSAGPYGVGCVQIVDGMPRVVGPDAPAITEGICPATVAAADLWKLGQLKQGDLVRFVPVTPDWAVQAEAAKNASIEELYADPVALQPRRRPWAGD